MENEFQYLDQFDTVLIVDDSRSMARKVLGELTVVAAKYDKDGIDIQFLNNPTVRNGLTIFLETREEVDKLFQSVTPTPGTPIGRKLESLLTLYINKFEELQRAGEKLKKVNYIFLTDGEPTTKFLQSLDDDLMYKHNIRDIVDTTPAQAGRDLSTNDMIKILTGGINRKLPLDVPPDSHIAVHFTQLPQWLSKDMQRLKVVKASREVFSTPLNEPQNSCVAPILAPMDLDLSTYDDWIYPERRSVQVVCWWEQTRLHKQIIFSVPLLPYTGGSYPSLQRSPMPSDTQAVFTVEILLNIVRGSLGGFYIPPDVVTDSRSREDNMFRFTFHGQHSESHQEPGHQLSTEELSVPLTELVGKLLWIKAERGSPPTQNLVNIRMQSTVEDKRNHPSDVR
ncbi:hypothetical protein IW262DRAFT_1295436 [Armillaria fumosa]|nr:hypothetical protein IW262DRAFT_1295436 [Armillaria fumosa]